VARARRRWQRRQGALDPARLVFIDESAAKTNLTRLRGRAPKGERLVCHTPHGHWRTTTMISSVRLDGTSACMTIEGATDTEVFQAYVREVLVPALRTGDIVIMDNLGAHKNDCTLALIAQAGAEVRLLARFEPHRDDVEQGEVSPPPSSGPHSPRPPSGHRGRATRRHRPGRPRLVCRLWL